MEGDSHAHSAIGMGYVLLGSGVELADKKGLATPKSCGVPKTG